jgi:predicted enzyme related to lactoylglutathione lyase
MGLPMIVFGVENVYEEYERLKNIGVSFKSAPTKNDWGTEVLLNDTFGNYIQLHQDL